MEWNRNWECLSYLVNFPKDLTIQVKVIYKNVSFYPESHIKTDLKTFYIVFSYRAKYFHCQTYVEITKNISD